MIVWIADGCSSPSWLVRRGIEKYVCVYSVSCHKITVFIRNGLKEKKWNHFCHSPQRILEDKTFVFSLHLLSLFPLIFFVDELNLFRRPKFQILNLPQIYSFSVNVTVTQFISSFNGISLLTESLHRWVFVYTLAVRSPLIVKLHQDWTKSSWDIKHGWILSEQTLYYGLTQRKSGLFVEATIILVSEIITALIILLI